MDFQQLLKKLKFWGTSSSGTTAWKKAAGLLLANMQKL